MPMTGYDEYWAEYERQEGAKKALSRDQREKLDALVNQRRLEFIRDKWGKYGILIVLMALGGFSLPFAFLVAGLMAVYPLAALATGTLVNRDEFHRIQADCISKITSAA